MEAWVKSVAERSEGKKVEMKKEKRILYERRPPPEVKETKKKKG
jgi:hypothetical protein